MGAVISMINTRDKYHNILLSRTAEIVFGCGLPITAFFVTANTGEPFPTKNFLMLIPFLLMTSVHVITFNDLCFNRRNPLTSATRKFHLKITLLLIPALILFLVPLWPSLCFMLLLIILNWDIYSYAGKKHWLSGWLHNLAGGILHFLAGASHLGVEGALSEWPMAFYFGLAMASGAIHHDALHHEEDSRNSYETGAVVFGPNLWWRMGFIPLLTAIPLLLFTPVDFALCFGLASLVYFFFYVALVIFPNPSEKIWFRVVCRLIFSVSAAFLVAIRIFSFLFW